MEGSLALETALCITFTNPLLSDISKSTHTWVYIVGGGCWTTQLPTAHLITHYTLIKWHYMILELLHYIWPSSTPPHLNLCLVLRQAVKSNFDPCLHLLSESLGNQPWYSPSLKSRASIWCWRHLPICLGYKLQQSSIL